MNNLGKVVVGGVVAGAVILGLTQNHHVAPANLYPNPAYTVGVAETLDVKEITASYEGKTYSQAHRNVTEAEKKAVQKEYNLTTGETDHFYPLCAGGSNDIRNLWQQPEHNIWQSQDFGFHAKDKLETWVCEQIKAGKLDPKIAFKKMTGDWVGYYLEVFAPNKPQNVAGVSEDFDGDK